ncbi:hypothetical protein D9M71_473350 [compost metagenome]
MQTIVQGIADTSETTCADVVQRFHVRWEGIAGERGPHDVATFACCLDHYIAGVGHLIVVAACAADHGVGSRPSDEDIVPTQPIEQVIPHVTNQGVITRGTV